jgi:D-3-phosphoglycerate dehydrogenase
MADAATWVFDFDSTLVDFETLERLADLSLEGVADAEARRAEIARLTDATMAGEVPFAEGLARRLALLPLTRDHVGAVAAEAVARLAPSVARNRAFFRDHADRIAIVSGGFREVIAPVAEALGVAPDRVVANDLLYDAEGRVTGVADSPLLHPSGKALALEAMPRPLVMIGDGWTDYEVRQAGVADRFYAFTEVVRREPVVAAADAEVRSLDEVLHLEGLAGRWSYPRSRMRILLLEAIHPAAVERLEGAGYQVETVKGALGEEALIERIKGVHVLGVRSKTLVTRRVLDAADKLMAVAALCVGGVRTSVGRDRGW